MCSALIDLTATQAVALMRSGDLRAEDYASALLSRAREVERLNAFRALNPDLVLAAAAEADRARAAAKPLGLLHGLPIPVKDSLNTRALPTSNGTFALRDFRPTSDARVLQRLFAQGAILMGKTNLHELSRGYTSNNAAFGAVLNPRNEAHVPGGSSGGSGAAVAAKIAPLAVAEDTMGSIRVPASMCGIVGLRPTHGRYPNDGIMSLTIDKFDQCGPLARTVADLALFDTAITGEPALDPCQSIVGVRLGFVPDVFLDSTDRDVARITHDVVRRLREAGAAIVEVPFPAECRDALPNAATIVAYENIASISAYLEEFGTGLSFEELLRQASPLIQSRYRVTVPRRETYEQALQHRGRARSAIRTWFEEHRVAALLFPSILSLPPPLGDNLEIEIDGRKLPILTVMGRNTSLGSLASLCSLVLPGGVARSNLPVGIEFAARPGGDRELLALGAAIEAVLSE